MTILLTQNHSSVFFLYLASAGCFIALFVHIVLWLLDPKGLRSLPGPFLAKLSPAWLSWAGHSGHTTKTLHEQHLKHGKFVRVAPDHVSIVDPDALHMIYGHGSGALKSDFYDAVVQFGGARSVFSTRSREDHRRKRKFGAHGLSLRSVMEYEPTISKYQRMFVDHWDHICRDAKNGLDGRIGTCTWTTRDGRAWFDCMPWLNYESFDIIGELSFGDGFGMVANGTDVVSIAKSQKAAMNSFGSEKLQLDMQEIPAVRTVTERSKFTATVGFSPAWVRPLIARFPGCSQGSKAMEAMGTMAVTAVVRRLLMPSDKIDILSKMVEVRGDDGETMTSAELSAEATTLLIAGTDTTSNSTCAIVYYLARDQQKQTILQQELDDVLGPAENSGKFEGYDELYEKVKSLPYLEAVIDEGLRLYSTVGTGLPRVVPKSGLTILGRTFTEGTILSVPMYTLHRDRVVWGEDADEFKPERWFTGDKTMMQRAFAPFSVGPRACLGRNLAIVELFTLVATLFHRYHFVLESPEQSLDVHEGLVRRALHCLVGVERRNSL